MVIVSSNATLTNCHSAVVDRGSQLAIKNSLSLLPVSEHMNSFREGGPCTGVIVEVAIQ